MVYALHLTMVVSLRYLESVWQFDPERDGHLTMSTGLKPSTLSGFRSCRARGAESLPVPSNSVRLPVGVAQEGEDPWKSCFLIVLPVTFIRKRWLSLCRTIPPIEPRLRGLPEHSVPLRRTSSPYMTGFWMKGSPILPWKLQVVTGSQSTTSWKRALRRGWLIPPI